jgi:hypothetical protein
MTLPLIYRDQLASLWHNPLRFLKTLPECEPDKLSLQFAFLLTFFVEPPQLYAQRFE